LIDAELNSLPVERQELRIRSGREVQAQGEALRLCPQREDRGLFGLPAELDGLPARQAAEPARRVGVLEEADLRAKGLTARRGEIVVE